MNNLWLMSQMILLFTISNAGTQHYQLYVFDKVKVTFHLRLEMKKFQNNKAVMDLKERAMFQVWAV